MGLVFEPIHQEGGSTRDTATSEDLVGADSCEITGSAATGPAKTGFAKTGFAKTGFAKTAFATIGQVCQ